MHLVFATKYRFSYFDSSELRKKIFEHIRSNGREKEIWIDAINGYEDHVHILFSLGREQTISKVAQLLKGESSFWINKNKLTPRKFMWQDDYWAAGLAKEILKIYGTILEIRKNIIKKRNLQKK